jgi:hypothetical protein
MSGDRAAFSLVTCFWPKNAPAFSAFATSLWLAAQKKVTRLRVREPDLNNIAVAIHCHLFSSHKKWGRNINYQTTPTIAQAYCLY